MSDFGVELVKLLMWIAIDWSISLIGGIIYGINKKVGIILAIVTGITVVTSLGWGCIFIIPTMTANDVSFGSLIGGAIGGLGFVPISSKGIEAGEAIKKVFKND